MQYKNWYCSRCLSFGRHKNTDFEISQFRNILMFPIVGGGRIKLQESHSEDWTMIYRFQQGDMGAFDALMHKYRHLANMYAFNLTRNHDDAADVVAESFFRVYRALSRFNGACSFSTWLYRIEMNCFLDIRKKASSRPTLSIDAGDYTERFEALLDVIGARKTAQGQMETFTMFHVESLSYLAIAEQLDVPVGTVKSRINRARATIRERLEWNLSPC